MTAPITIERVVSASLFRETPVAGQYFTSPTGKTAIVVTRVRPMMGERAGLRYRLFGTRLRLSDVPQGIDLLPWPRALPSARKSPQKADSQPRQPATIVPAHIAQAEARKRIKILLRDDRDKDRLIHQARLDNGTVVVGEWRDPDDTNPNRRVARVVRGYRSRDSIEILLDSGTISKSHARAARRFRKEYELGEIGLRASRNPAEAPTGFDAPTGPSEARMRHLEVYRETLGALSSHLLDVLLAIVIRDESAHTFAKKKKMSRSAVAGYILACLDHLKDHYDEVDKKGD